MYLVTFYIDCDYMQTVVCVLSFGNVWFLSLNKECTFVCLWCKVVFVVVVCVHCILFIVMNVYEF